MMTLASSSCMKCLFSICVAAHRATVYEMLVRYLEMLMSSILFVPKLFYHAAYSVDLFYYGMNLPKFELVVSGIVLLAERKGIILRFKALSNNFESTGCRLGRFSYCMNHNYL